MANGRPGFRGPREPQIERRQNERQQNRRRQDSDRQSLFFEDDDRDETTALYPTTNRALRSASRYLSGPFRDGLGLTADTLEISPRKLTLKIDPTGEIIRQPRIEAENLTGRDELVGEIIRVKKEKDRLELGGQFSPDVATAIVLDLGKDEKGNDRGQVAGAFQRASLDTIRGDSGPTALLDALPGHKINERINEESFMIGRRGSEEVIVAVATADEAAETQRDRINRTRIRIQEAARGRIQAAMARDDAEEAARLSTYAADLMKQREVILIEPERLPSDVEESMQTITTQINGESETITGFAHLDTQNHTVTIARPVYIKPERQGIDPTSIRTIDGTGLEREFRWVRGDLKTGSAQLKQVLRYLRGAALVQEVPRGPIILPPTKSSRALLKPYSVPPTIN